MRINIKKENVVYGVFSIALLLLFFMIFSIKSEGSEKQFFSDDTKKAETEYVSELRSVLCDMHFNNAGVTLTKISEDGLNVQYTASIHLSRAIDEDELLKALYSVDIDVENSEVKIIIS